MKEKILILIIIFISSNINAATYLVKGIVTDSGTKEPLGFANIVFTPNGNAMQAGADGAFTTKIEEGAYTITVSYVGYKTFKTSINVNKDKFLAIPLVSKDNELNEIVVTAKESLGLASSSRIDRNAMTHLQPSSFTDLLELLPGNITKTPNMSSVNTIELRETGNLTASGATSSNPDYSISSLGTVFMVDGAPINGDANLQYVPSSSETKTDMTNRGVDMRTISTDNIESVEIVRGIPSAEYGNLTSGIVNIKRIRTATPLSARFKADGYSKLFSIGKGFYLGKSNHIMNLDGGYLDSKSDPRNTLENYKRVNLSSRFNMKFTNIATDANWIIGVDYTGSFDNSKNDPDLTQLKIDEYKSKYNRYALTSDFNIVFKKLKWLNSVNINTSASYQNDLLERLKQVSPQRSSVAPTSMDSGVHDGQLLLGEYIASYICEGKPFNSFVKVKADGSESIGKTKVNYKIGSEWTISKNFGKGQIYDLTKPISASWTTRPRAYNEIPTLNVLSFFAEGSSSIPIHGNNLQLQTGIRSIQLLGLDKKFLLRGKAYLDPRFNAKWEFPAIAIGKHNLKLSLSGGYGITTKMPTIDYLYPQVRYNDFIQLNYYDSSKPAEYSRINLRTYIDDKTNYNLKPARNNKFEVRLGASLGSNSFSITYFNEKMTSGYRYSTLYRPYSYDKYDASAINASELTGPPSLDNIPFTSIQVLSGYSQVSNGSTLDKEGIEFQISTARLKQLATSLTISGAWFHTTYSNSQEQYMTVNDVVSDKIISNNYIGLYESNSGRTNNSCNTNFMFDTQIKRWGVIFTTSIQCMWFVSTQRMFENGVPIKYMDVSDGQLHDYTDDCTNDQYLKFLIKYYNNDSFKKQTVPPAVYINLKATKEIGKYMRIAAFATRLFDYLPSYQSNGLLVRRSSQPYFGMELNIKI